MSYQSVGTPRFFVNDALFCLKSGLAIESTEGNAFLDGSIFELNPSIPSQIPFDYNHIITPKSNSINYIAFLGHNFSESGTHGYIAHDNGTPVTGDNGNINYPNSGESDIEFNGFSMHLFDAIDEENITVIFNETNANSNALLGAISVGKFYELPHAPDLNLTMSKSYEGIKEITTMGGHTLSNSLYSKPPKWAGGGSAWELYRESVDINLNKLSRSGRKKWNLNFSFLQSSDTHGLNQMLYSDTLISEAAGLTFDDGDIEDDGTFKYNILTDDNFYSQVIHKTNGGQLPFIFQPDKNYPEFSIAKFDMNAFSFTQQAPNLYSVSLQIKEVW